MQWWMPPPGLEAKADLDPEVVVSEKTGDIKGISDVWPEDVKAAGDWLAEIKPIMMDLSTSAAVWWEHIMNNAERAYQKWLDMRPVDRLNVAPEEPAYLAKYPFSRVEQRGAGLLLPGVASGTETGGSVKKDVVSGRHGLQGAHNVSARGASREAEPPQLLG